MKKELKYAGLDKAIMIASTAFEGEYDKGGVPYIMHCLYVMNGVRHLGYKAMMIGVLHDLVEDTDWNAVKLSEAGFHDDVVMGVVTMTHLDGESYDEYLDRIITFGGNVVHVKMADLEHNMQPQRLKDVRPKDFERLTKYAKAYKRLEKLL